MKVEPKLRRSLCELMLALSDGRRMVNPAEQVRLEWERHKYGYSTDWLRARLVQSRDPWLAFDPDGRPESLKEFPDPLPIICGLGDTRIPADTHVQSVFETAATAVNAAGDRLFESYIGTQLTRGNEVTSSDSPDLEHQFPSLAMRKALLVATKKSRKKHGVEANDIVDTAFAAATLPYFDIVTCDRRTAARIRETGVATRATVVAKFDELREVMERHLREHSKV